ncbi:hypothetical protein BV22DRAFT_423192 [Leucogyrophana mollusca]|uniref:Uncharacterized protein n=1 Tax=Leucogyrophana mollusca TaxID=85980 RepID=A0ACB8BLW3_9AGAM|nr:hypothetical protein BV22DRAFT_423192 [Leucogyrophana mollusca]
MFHIERRVRIISRGVCTSDPEARFGTHDFKPYGYEDSETVTTDCGRVFQELRRWPGGIWGRSRGRTLSSAHVILVPAQLPPIRCRSRCVWGRVCTREVKKGSRLCDTGPGSESLTGLGMRGDGINDSQKCGWSEFKTQRIGGGQHGSKNNTQKKARVASTEENECARKGRAGCIPHHPLVIPLYYLALPQCQMHLFDLGNRSFLVCQPHLNPRYETYVPTYN